MLKSSSLGLRPIGFVAESDSPPLGELPWLGPPAALAGVAREYSANRALVAVHGFDAEELADLVSLPNAAIRHWIFLPPMEQFPGLWAASREIGGLPALETSNRLASPLRRGLKRIFDLSLAIVLGVVIVPLLALIAVLIRTTSPGPVFYSQERIGWHGRRFRAWKFRSMRRDADEVLQQYLAEHPELLAEWQANHKLKHDPRITWVGRWLRLTSLDELPQIWNVLCGEMSLIGPRPIVEAEIEKYGHQYEHYIQVVPGITGLWQISGRNNTTYDERVNYDAYYVRNWSLWLDLYILACTARVVLLGEGAY
jgi:Undecaprenyl-phosphate galactose phosphotransferase WbaP